MCNLIREKQPQIIINAATYAAIDKVENELELAKSINRSVKLN
ncbi:sugar nucleotide-binding protein [Fischerella thermalis]|nr:sugar nucleotide-binding protein [Fischerella thermalis]